MTAMGKCEQMRRHLEPLLAAGDREQLVRFLLEHSNLPGPRANLELAQAFGLCHAHAELPGNQWQTVCTLLAEAMQDQFCPAEREFLPVCGLHALGAHYAHASVERKCWIAQELRRLANAPDWRVRESVAIALQIMAEWDFTVVTGLTQSWLDSGPTLLEARAVAAALAHPPALSGSLRTAVALRMMQQIVTVLKASQQRKTDGFRVLRQALEYAVSVVVAADPTPGFVVLASLATDSDADVQRVVRKNLEKNRLRRHASEVELIKAMVDGSRSDTRKG